MKSKTNVVKEIQELSNAIDSRDISLKTVTDNIYRIVDPGSSERAYYERIRRFKAGEASNITDSEKKVIRRYIDILEHPFKYVQAFHIAGDVKKKTAYLIKQYSNPQTERKIVRQLNALDLPTDSQS